MIIPLCPVLFPGSADLKKKKKRERNRKQNIVVVVFFFSFENEKICRFRSEDIKAKCRDERL